MRSVMKEVALGQVFPPSTLVFPSHYHNNSDPYFFVIGLSEGKAADVWERLHQPFLAWV